MKSRQMTYFSGILLVLATLFSMPVLANQEQQWRFRVFLDDQPIGYHDFRLRSQSDNSQQLEIDARFDVKFLFFTAYRYRHSNTEVWQNRCLQRIEARTDDNGQRYVVHGSHQAGSFNLATGEQAMTADGCIKTFAYWDPSILRADRLLNAQTGEFVDVRTDLLGEDTIEVRGQPVTARHYRLRGEGIEIDLWYAVEGNRWLALQSMTDSGRTLSYRMQ